VTARPDASSASGLPDFDSPPVIEVALSVGFERLPGLRTVEFGPLWRSLFRDSFPKVVEQAPIVVATETFDSTSTASDSPQVEVLAGALAPRLWFVNEEDSDLVQLQNDWFARNWRKTPSGAPYPRFPAVMVQFERNLSDLLDYLHKEGLGSFQPTQCEVTYINHVESAFPHEVLRDVKRPRVTPPLEGMNLNAHFVLVVGDEPVGRLHFITQSAVRRVDQQRITVLTLTARGRPLSADIEGVLGFMELGHTEIVKAFEAMTSKEMHEVWGRRST
jgi:uncharacterized protein (TIGR04255 family)